ncbi:hypothetical protein PG987_016389 [Apiospora arundinis]
MAASDSRRSCSSSSSRERNPRCTNLTPWTNEASDRLVHLVLVTTLQLEKALLGYHLLTGQAAVFLLNPLKRVHKLPECTPGTSTNPQSSRTSTLWKRSESTA